MNKVLCLAVLSVVVSLVLCSPRMARSAGAKTESIDRNVEPSTNEQKADTEMGPLKRILTLNNQKRAGDGGGCVQLCIGDGPCEVVSGVCPPQDTGTPGICVSDCEGQANGDYQSCNGCDVYVTCSNGFIYDNRDCAAGTVWDDNLKRCEFKSTTCT